MPIHHLLDTIRRAFCGSHVATNCIRLGQHPPQVGAAVADPMPPTIIRSLAGTLPSASAEPREQGAQPPQRPPQEHTPRKPDLFCMITSRISESFYPRPVRTSPHRNRHADPGRIVPVFYRLFPDQSNLCRSMPFHPLAALPFLPSPVKKCFYSSK